METLRKQKDTLKQIALRCYEISRNKNFNNLKVSITANKTIIGELRSKLSLIDLIDDSSETYKSIICVGKKALYELQNECYEVWYTELLRLIISLPENIKYKKSKQVVFFPDIIRKKPEAEPSIIIPETKKITYAPVGITGPKLKRIIQEETIDRAELESMYFEEDEDEDNDLVTEDVDLTEEDEEELNSFEL